MKVAIIGYGKMGREIEALLLQKGYEVPVKIDISNQHDFNQENMRNVDVAIEFTTPQTAYDNVMNCLRWGVPVVSGSTGWNDRLEEVKKYCTEVGGTFFHASNYSIGVNIFFRINEYLARMMNGQPDYEVSMREIHHIQKKDAPSGTAVTLAESIIENIDRKQAWVNHETQDETALGIISVREDAVPGTHEVKYESAADIIEIVHTAKSRAGFVHGAVMAAEYAATHKGVLSMSDLLKF